MDIENESESSSELCRLCANTDKQLIPIFQGEGIEHNIAEQIEKYLPIVKVFKNSLLAVRYSVCENHFICLSLCR